jgi:hypothetical protein
LIYSAAGYVALNPHATNDQFLSWASSVQALDRFPELVGLGQAVIVTAAQVPAFEAGALANPSGGLADVEATFQVIPPGDRPFYCFSTAGIARTLGSGLPPGFDYCSGSLGTAGLAARDSGVSSYIPLTTGASTFLVVLSPVYSGGGAPPTTVDGRQRSFVGWIGMQVLPQMLLRRATAGHPGMGVTLSYHAGTSTAVFHDDPAINGPYSITTDLRTAGPCRPTDRLPRGASSPIRSRCGPLSAGSL